MWLETTCSDQAITLLSCHLRIEILSLHLLATCTDQVPTCLNLPGCRYITTGLIAGLYWSQLLTD